MELLRSRRDFILEIIAGFLLEGTTQTMLEMGLITSIVAVIWDLLLGPFLFAKSKGLLYRPSSRLKLR